MKFYKFILFLPPLTVAIIHIQLQNEYQSMEAGEALNLLLKATENDPDEPCDALMLLRPAVSRKKINLLEQGEGFEVLESFFECCPVIEFVIKTADESNPNHRDSQPIEEEQSKQTSPPVKSVIAACQPGSSDKQIIFNDVSGVVYTEEGLKSLFCRLDCNSNGFLDVHEFKSFYETLENFGTTADPSFVDGVMRQVCIG